MTKLEKYLVYCFITFLCPLLLFVLFWWVTAVLVMNSVLHIPEGGIAIAAFFGLGAGITLDLIYIRKWVARFYSVDMRLVVLVYLCFSVIAVAFFMGLPIGIIVLGMLAGAYIGRRMYHNSEDEATFSTAVKKISLFTATVTGIEALLIGLLVLNDDWVVEWLQKVSRMNASKSFGGIGLMIIVLCLILMVVQYVCTKALAQITYGHSKPDAI
jgi:hypothetical protein